MSELDTARLAVGDELPTRIHLATNVSLFLYNAAVWNPHRIHYDETYTKERENHPGIVIDGPLQGDWLCQCAVNWIGTQGELVMFSYSNRRAAYLGEKLTTSGVVTAVDQGTGRVAVELYVKNEQGEVIAPGKAELQLTT